MPAVKPITVLDGAATPVSHTFTPIKVNGDLASFVERKGLTTLGWNGMDVTVKDTGKSSPVVRVTLKIALPNIITTTPPGSTASVESLDSSDGVTIEFLLAKKGSVAGRKNLRTITVNSLLNADIISVIENLENMY